MLYLAQRFSPNSKAAIIYTQNRFATEDVPKGFDSQQNMIPLPDAERQRIRAMGVELILPDELGELTAFDAQHRTRPRRCAPTSRHSVRAKIPRRVSGGGFLSVLCGQERSPGHDGTSDV